MIRILFSLLLSCGLLPAQGPLAPPSIGMLRGSDNGLRPLLGVRGNFLLGEPVAKGVESAAFSGDFGLIKTRDEVVLIARDDWTGRHPASGEAILGLDASGRRAAAWLPADGRLIVWANGRWIEARCELTGRVVAVAPGAASVRIATEEATGVRVVSVHLSRRLTIEREFISGAQAPLWMGAEGSLIYSDGLELVLRGGRGVETRLSLPAPIAVIEPVTVNAWRLESEIPGTSYFLDAGGTSPRLYQLPGGAR